jgi:hypothetical protein
MWLVYEKGRNKIINIKVTINDNDTAIIKVLSHLKTYIEAYEEEKRIYCINCQKEIFWNEKYNCWHHKADSPYHECLGIAGPFLRHFACPSEEKTEVVDILKI